MSCSPKVVTSEENVRVPGGRCAEGGGAGAGPRTEKGLAGAPGPRGSGCQAGDFGRRGPGEKDARVPAAVPARCLCFQPSLCLSFIVA